MNLELRNDVVFVASNRASLMLDHFESALGDKGISSIRIEPCEELCQQLETLRPRVLILDFLLDAFGTAVDLLGLDNRSKDTRVLIWTDEPELEIAVELMKLGADDFILSNRPKSIDRAIKLITGWLAKDETDNLIVPENNRLIANSPAMHQAMATALSISSSPASVACLYGAPGTGRNRVAQEIQLLRNKNFLKKAPGGFISLDWELQAPKDLVQFIRTHITPGTTLFIEHLDNDTGECIEELESISTWLESQGILILLGIRSDSLLRLFTRVFPDGQCCELPTISERAEDLVPLLRTELSDGQLKSLSLSAELISKLLQLEWPGNVRQLISCMKEVYFLCKSSKESPSEEQILSHTKESHARWIRLHGKVSTNKPSSLSIYRAFCESGCSIRRTAAILGTNTRYVSRKICSLFGTQSVEVR